MSKTEITDRSMDSSVTLPGIKDTAEHCKFGCRQVRPTAVKKLMPEVSASGKSDAGCAIAQRGRKMSLDSGIGSINSSEGMPDIDPEDANAIGRELERIYQDLFAGGARLDNLPRVRQALKSESCKALFDVMTKYNLQHYGEGMVESGRQLLACSEKIPAPEIPPVLVRKYKHYEKLRIKSNRLSHKVNLKATPANVKKAIRKNDELTRFNQNKLTPAKLEFDQTIYSLIDQQPAFQELRACLESIKALLPDSVEVSAPIDITIRTWAFNVLLERSKAAAGISGLN